MDHAMDGLLGVSAQCTGSIPCADAFRTRRGFLFDEESDKLVLKHRVRVSIAAPSADGDVKR
jgi:hypothetical protein